jgi:hypothetical protein
MELNPSGEVVSCSVTQDCPNILWNLKINFGVCWLKIMGAVMVPEISLIFYQNSRKRDVINFSHHESFRYYFMNVVIGALQYFLS